MIVAIFSGFSIKGFSAYIKFDMNRKVITVVINVGVFIRVFFNC
jgi:hypothetical protein